jgi:hypothetical protein
MKVVALLVALLTFAAPAVAQDSKYAGTGMSVTGPASEKKAPASTASPVKAVPAAPTEKVQHGAQGTSEEETPGTNSATSNSH